MSEDFLHYVWRLQLFNLQNLLTARGLPLEILHPGTANRDAGPDFSNARIKIGTTLWAGNIEIHTHPGEWKKHGHHQDDAYKSVILHVVYDLNGYILTAQEPDCFELKAFISPQIISRYNAFLSQPQWIPCERLVHELPSEVTPFWLQRLCIERLEQKTIRIQQDLEAQIWDWEEVFYQHLARTLGMKVNGDAMHLLAKRTPAKLLIKHGDNLFQMEALLFGQSGLLDTTAFHDDYPRRLKMEYEYLKETYSLQSLPITMWKFMRMRPANFPTLRIAQLAMLMHKTQHLFSKVIAARSIKELENIFEIRVSQYWHDHYVFDKASEKGSAKSLGKQVVHNLIINTFVPFIFLYGRHKQMNHMEDHALDLLTQLSPEKNHISQGWSELGFSINHAGDSQAFIQLYDHYCSLKKCLQCQFGHALMKK